MKSIPFLSDTELDALTIGNSSGMYEDLSNMTLAVRFPESVPSAIEALKTCEAIKYGTFF